MATGFKWVRPPENLAKAIEQYGKRAFVAIHAAAAYAGQEMQNSARSSAPWQDRTGNARGGLFFAVDGLGRAPIIGKVSVKAGAGTSDVTIESGDDKTLILTLGHTMYYGKYLETAHGAKYAVVMSTLEGHLPALESMLQDVFK